MKILQAWNGAVYCLTWYKPEMVLITTFWKLKSLSLNFHIVSDISHDHSCVLWAATYIFSVLVAWTWLILSNVTFGVTILDSGHCGSTYGLIQDTVVIWLIHVHVCVYFRGPKRSQHVVCCCCSVGVEHIASYVWLVIRSLSCPLQRHNFDWSLGAMIYCK